MTSNDCPDSTSLLAFVECRVSDVRFKEISLHLDNCEKCSVVVEEMEQDISNQHRQRQRVVRENSFVVEHVPGQFEGKSRKERRNVECRSNHEHPTIPGYQIVSLIERGGMGSVFKAMRSGTEEVVAVKVLNQKVDPQQVSMQMFLREASVLSQLRHPSIIEFREVGWGNGKLFIAMEYVDCLDLRSLLRSLKQPSRIRLSCGLVGQVLSALEHAHRRGVVHRDVKPSNILTTRVDGKYLAKLGDFGLAKCFQTAGFSAMTAEGEARGTLNYMAPEQLTDSRGVKPSADIYSTGVTLFHFLADRLPFETSDSRESAIEVRRRPKLKLNEVLHDIPDRLSDLIYRAMAENPDDRFSSALEMKKAIIPFINP